MKKLWSFLIIICMLPQLSGCGGIYANYRELEQLLVIQTLGLDHMPGGVLLSMASAPGAEESAPICLSGAGESVSGAMENIKNRSSQEDLFFSHTNSVVLGEEAAKNGVDSYLAYVCRAPELRLDMPLFLVKDGSALEALSGSESSRKGIAESLHALKSNMESRGDGNVFYVSEIIRNMSRDGSALVCALELSASSEKELGEGGGSGQGGEALTAAYYGYGILKHGKLIAYMDRKDAIGVGFLMDKVGLAELTVTDMNGSPVTLLIDKGGASLSPIWGPDGSLKGIDVQADVRAAVLEMSKDGNLDDPDYADALTSRLEMAVSERIRAVLSLAKELGSDFLCLTSHVELAEPMKYRALDKSIEELLPGLEFSISVSGQLSHTNDIKDA